jgi:hypothetical protein
VSDDRRDPNDAAPDATRDDASPPPPLDTLAPDVRAALVPESVRAATRARLLARARADTAGTDAADAPDVTAARTTESPPLTVVRGGVRDAAGTGPTAGDGRRTGARAVTGLLAIALAASVALLVRAERARDAAESALATASVRAAVADSLAAQLAERDARMASLTGADVVVVDLASADAADPRALMFWDRARDRWTFVAHRLPPIGADRTYQLWLVTDDARISAGTFRAEANGDAVVEATYALDRTALRAVAVTVEPAGGVAQPTGPMVVVGSVASE